MNYTGQDLKATKIRGIKVYSKDEYGFFSTARQDDLKKYDYRGIRNMKLQIA